jgi:hypothetical protein
MHGLDLPVDKKDAMGIGKRLSNCVDKCETVLILAAAVGPERSPYA